MRTRTDVNTHHTAGPTTGTPSRIDSSTPTIHGPAATSADWDDPAYTNHARTSAAMSSWARYSVDTASTAGSSTPSGSVRRCVAASSCSGLLIGTDAKTALPTTATPAASRPSRSGVGAYAVRE